MMATHFTTLLAAAATQPEQTVAGLCLLTPQDRQLLARFSSGPLRPDYLEQPLLPAAFEVHAAARPDHPCLVFEGQVLTYGQVNARANALAAHLAGLGVHANMPVGVMLNRGFDLLIGFLAVMKVCFDHALAAPSSLLQCRPAAPGLSPVAVRRCKAVQLGNASSGVVPLLLLPSFLRQPHCSAKSEILTAVLPRPFSSIHYLEILHIAVSHIAAHLQAGGCYVPLDPAYPDDRLAIYLEDAASTALLTTADHAERAAALAGSSSTLQVSSRIVDLLPSSNSVSRQPMTGR